MGTANDDHPARAVGGAETELAPSRRLGLSVPEMRGHARLLAVIGWLLVVGLGAALFLGRMRAVPQPDFLLFYALGDLARTGDIATIYEPEAVHARQMAIVPDSDPETAYPNPYSPLVALAFAPFCRLSFPMAWAYWGALTLAAYLITIRAIARAAGVTGADWRAVRWAALAFPPIWLLVATGQTGIVPFVALAAAGAALERNKPILTGLAMSLLALKPQHAVIFVPLLLLTRQWRIIGGALLGVMIQLRVTAALVGAPLVLRSFTALLAGGQRASVGEPKPFLQHSLRMLTVPMPPVVYLLLCVGVVWLVWQTWQRSSDWRVRISAAVLGSVLVNPHFFVYDAIVLALPALWLSGVVDQAWLARRAYVVSALLLFPTAAVVPVQGSVLALAFTLWQLAHRWPADDAHPARGGSSPAPLQEHRAGPSPSSAGHLHGLRHGRCVR